MKKLLATLMACALLVCVPTGIDVKAADIGCTLSVQYNGSDLKSKNINKMSDSEFDDFLMNYIQENKKNGMSFDKIKTNLQVVGVVVTEKDNSSNSERSAKYCGISALSSFYMYSAHRTGDSYYRLYSYLSFNSTETTPGSYDLLSIEWNPNIASYYSTNPDTANGMYNMDGSNRTNGIYLFNFNDLMFQAGYGTYAAVYVTPKVTGTEMEIGSKYVHTYNTTTTTWSLGTNYAFSASGPTGGGTYTISGSIVTTSWQTYADNAITFN